MSVEASATDPFAGDEVTFSAVIANAPDGEEASYEWEIGYGGDFWLPAGSDATFSYLPAQPETASVRVTVGYASGESAVSEPLSVTWRPSTESEQTESEQTEPEQTGPEQAEPVSVSIRYDEERPELFEPARLVAEVANLPDGEQPSYSWEMNLGDGWQAVGTEREFPWSPSVPETARFRVTVFYGDDESVTSDELAGALAGAGAAGNARSTRDVTSAATSVALIRNDGQENNVLTNLGDDRAQSFTTGSNIAGYKLTSVQIRFGTAGSVPDHSVTIMDDDGSGAPGTEVGTLSTHSSVTAGLNSFAGDVDLDADTTYYVVVDMEVGKSTIKLTATTHDGEDAGGAAGWSIGNLMHWRNRNNSGGWKQHSSGSSLMIVVNGYAKSPPVVDSAEVDGTELVLTFDADLDTASGTAAGAFTINVDGGDAQAATAITIAGRTVTLTVPAVTAGQRVTVSYAKPTTNPLQGVSGEEVDAFTDQAVLMALIGNSGETNQSSYLFANDGAQAFTTGSYSAGYKLTSVQIFIGSGGMPPGHAMKIMDDNGSGAPGTTTVGTLNSPTSFVAGISNEFTGVVDLDAGTTYHVVMDLAAGSSNPDSVTWRTTNSNNEDSGGAPGWSIGDAFHTRSSDASSWTENSQELKIVVNGHANPPPPALESAQIDSVELVLTFDENLDKASGTAPGAFAIKVGSGSAKAATAITIAGRTVTLTVPAVTAAQTVQPSRYTKTRHERRSRMPDPRSEVSPVSRRSVPEATIHVVTRPSSTRRPVVLIKNNGQPQTSIGSDIERTIGLRRFRTGSYRAGYKLTSVQIDFEAVGASLSGYSVNIMNDNGSGAPGTTVGTLSTLSSVTLGLNEFTGDVDLAANTTYYVVVDVMAANRSFTIQAASSDNEDAGGATGWSIGNAHHRRLPNNNGGWILNLRRF